MPESYSNLQPGQYPLKGWTQRPEAEKKRPMPFLPELHVTVGQDLVSAGLTVGVWLPTGGVHPNYRVLYAARWASPMRTPQEALETCLKGVAHALAELFPECHSE
jgi:hypothetical protein